MIYHKKKKSVTTKHYYRVDIFTATIAHQLQKLNNKFCEQATKNVECKFES